MPADPDCPSVLQEPSPAALQVMQGMEQLLAQIRMLADSPDRQEQWAACLSALKLGLESFRIQGRNSGLDYEAISDVYGMLMMALKAVSEGSVPALFSPLKGEIGLGKGNRPHTEQEWIGRVFAVRGADIWMLRHKGAENAFRKVVRDVENGLKEKGIIGFPQNWHWKRLQKYRWELSRGGECGPGGQDGNAWFNYLELGRQIDRVGWSQDLYDKTIREAIKHLSRAYNSDAPPRTSIRVKRNM